MKKILLATIIVFASSLSLFAQKDGKIRFDGLYQADEGEYSHFFRFYPDESVISVSSTGEAAVIAEWFKQPYYDGGKYKISKKKISFECTSDDGTVVYKGVIKSEDELYLKSKSLINGYKGKATYKFVKL